MEGDARVLQIAAPQCENEIFETLAGAQVDGFLHPSFQDERERVNGGEGHLAPLSGSLRGASRFLGSCHCFRSQGTGMIAERSNRLFVNDSFLAVFLTLRPALGAERHAVLDVERGALAVLTLDAHDDHDLTT